MTPMSASSRPVKSSSRSAISSKRWFISPRRGSHDSVAGQWQETKLRMAGGQFLRDSVVRPLSTSQRQRQRAGAYFAVTSAPLYINLFHNWILFSIIDLLFGTASMLATMNFQPTRQNWGPRNTMINPIDNVKTVDLISWKPRAPAVSTCISISRSQSMAVHISEFPVGSYKKAHRHGTGALTILNGQGYTVLWRQGASGLRSIGSLAASWCCRATGFISILIPATRRCATSP